MTNLIQFVEACEAATDRSTFYHSADQQVESIETLHKAVLDYDRALYCLTEVLSGFNDYNKLLITRNLLFHTGYILGNEGARKYVRYGKSDGFAVRFGQKEEETPWLELENRIIRDFVWRQIPITRLLREFASWRKKGNINYL